MTAAPVLVSGGVIVALVRGESGQAAAQEDDVHAGVVACQGGEAIGCHLLAEPEVLGRKAVEAATSSTFSDTADEVIFTSWLPSRTRRHAARNEA